MTSAYRNCYCQTLKIFLLLLNINSYTICNNFKRKQVIQIETGFLKGYFRKKKGFKSEKRFCSLLILHSRCFEIQF